MFGWLIGSRIGRAVAAIGAALMALLAIFAMGTRKGKAKAENDALRRRVQVSDDARRVQDDVSKISDDAVHSELRGWMRDNDSE